MFSIMVVWREAARTGLARFDGLDACSKCGCGKGQIRRPDASKVAREMMLPARRLVLIRMVLMEAASTGRASFNLLAVSDTNLTRPEKRRGCGTVMRIAGK